jgi:hypothetical protein
MVEPRYSDRFLLRRTPAELVALIAPELAAKGYRLTTQNDQLATFHKAKKTFLTGGIMGAALSTDRAISLMFSEANAEGYRYMQVETNDLRLKGYFDKLDEFRVQPS